MVNIPNQLSNKTERCMWECYGGKGIAEEEEMIKTYLPFELSKGTILSFGVMLTYEMLEILEKSAHWFSILEKHYALIF